MADYFYNVEQPSQEKKFDPKEFLKVFSVIFSPSLLLIIFLYFLPRLDTNLDTKLGFGYNFLIILILGLFLISLLIGIISRYNDIGKFLRFFIRLSGAIIGLELGVFVAIKILSSTPGDKLFTFLFYGIPIMLLFMSIGTILGIILGNLIINKIWPGLELELNQSTNTKLLELLVSIFLGGGLGFVAYSYVLVSELGFWNILFIPGGIIVCFSLIKLISFIRRK